MNNEVIIYRYIFFIFVIVLVNFIVNIIELDNLLFMILILMNDNNFIIINLNYV